MFYDGNSVDITPVRNAHTGSYTTYVGTFETPAELVEAHPIGNEGEYADIDSTKTVWVWSDKANNWVDTGDPALLFEVR